MKTRMIVILLVIIALATGTYIGTRLAGPAPGEGDAGGMAAAGEGEILYWVAPMDPNFRRDEPGKSPMGMDLVPVYADQAGEGDAVTIDPSVVNNLGVRTAPATIRPLWRKVEATGYVSFDETRISHINLRTQGWINRLLVDSEGERVRDGDLLFELYSPELVNAQKEYLQAHQRGDERLRRGAREKLLALGMIRREIETLERTGRVSENIQVVAPQDGIIASLNVREGMFVQPNTTVMSLADLSTVWLLAEVFESQAEAVAEGQAAEARLDYLPGKVFSGQVDYVYPVLDPATRTLRVRLRFENPDEQLKPNMYARVSIFGKLRPAALSIPREALIRAAGTDRVVVALGDGRFRVHEVLAGMESGEWVEIIAGISEGDRVVTSAQFLIDSEASLAGTIHRLDESGAARSADEVVRAFGSGWVDEVNRDEGTVRVSHGPIESLGWPSMTMVFDVGPEIDLASVDAGQDVRFVLLQEQGGEFVIERISLRDDLVEVDGDFPDESFPAAVGEAQRLRYTGEGEVREVRPADGILNLAHEPIEALGWPAMTMDFDVRQDVDLTTLRPGDRIHFTMRKHDDGFVIDQVHVVGGGADREHRHD